MSRKVPPSVYLLAFVVASVLLIALLTPATSEKASLLARAISWNMLTASDTGSPAIYTKGEFVGVGTPFPSTALHVTRKHPDVLKVENDSKGGNGWVFQVGGNGWQDGNLLIKNAATNKHGLVIEPSGRVIVMGDMFIRGKLASAQPLVPPVKEPVAPKDPAESKEVKELQGQVQDLLATVESLQKRIEGLESKKTRSTKP